MTDKLNELLSAVPGVSRRAVLAGAAATVAAPFVIGAARAADRPIRIGFVSPRTGPLAPFASADPFILKGVRDVLAGGLTIGGRKYAVEILERDSQSSPSRAADVAASLIQGDNADLILGSSTADTTNPVADQCEANQVPCITSDTPWEPHFFGRSGDPKKGFDWTYHFFWGQEQLVRSYTGLWSALQTNKTVGALWSNDADGVALGNAKTGMMPGITAAGFKVVDLGLFTPMSGDFASQIARLKAASADIVTGVFLPPDFTTFWTQCAQQGYHPKAVTVAKALLFPSSVEALGARGIGLSSEEWWSPHHPFSSGLTGQTSAQLCDAYTKATDRQWIQPMGFKHALLEVACDVLKRSKDPHDAAAVRDAIAATDYHSIVGPISWKHGPVKNVALTPLTAGQWIKGDRWPFEIVVVNDSADPMVPVQQAPLPLPS